MQNVVKVYFVSTVFDYTIISYIHIWFRVWYLCTLSCQHSNEIHTVTYHAAILEDWNRSTTEKNIYVTDLMQEEENDVFFEQDLLADFND